MKRYGDRPSVRPSMGIQQQTRCWFAAVGPAVRGYRSTAAILAPRIPRTVTDTSERPFFTL